MNHMHTKQYISKTKLKGSPRKFDQKLLDLRGKEILPKASQVPSQDSHKVATLTEMYESTSETEPAKVTLVMIRPGQRRHILESLFCEKGFCV